MLLDPVDSDRKVVLVRQDPLVCRVILVRRVLQDYQDRLDPPDLQDRQGLMEPPEQLDHQVHLVHLVHLVPLV